MKSNKNNDEFPESLSAGHEIGAKFCKTRLSPQSVCNWGNNQQKKSRCREPEVTAW